MKKCIIIIVLLIVSSSYCYSQGLTKSAEGESTVLFRGNTISADLGETELGLSFNNLQKSIGESSYFIFGGSVKGKNESGVAGLFSKGDFVPSSSLNSFIGWSTSNGVPAVYKNSYAKKLDKYDKFLRQSDVNLTASFINIISIETKNIPGGGLALKNELEQLFSGKTQKQFINALKQLNKNDANEKKAIKSITDKCEIIYNNWEKINDKYESQIKKIEKNISETSFNQFSLFLFGGINSSKFKQYVGTNLDTLNNSFKDVNFRGGNFGLGVNYQYRNWMFGASYSYSKTNNFKLLTKKDYTLKTVEDQTTGGQQLIQEKKITAYSGNYDDVEINEFNIDVIYKASLDKELKNHILINPYLRSQLKSRKKEILPNSLNFGCGFHFFNTSGKFLAGFYVELPDVENNYEKAKPIEDQNLRPPFERLSLGIVTKLSLSTVLDIF